MLHSTFDPPQHSKHTHAYFNYGIYHAAALHSIFQRFAQIYNTKTYILAKHFICNLNGWVYLHWTQNSLASFTSHIPPPLSLFSKAYFANKLHSFFSFAYIMAQLAKNSVNGSLDLCASLCPGHGKKKSSALAFPTIMLAHICLYILRIHSVRSGLWFHHPCEKKWLTSQMTVECLLNDCWMPVKCPPITYQ